MYFLSRKLIVLCLLISTFIFAASEVMANDKALYFDFKSNPVVHELTDKISMQFVTSSQFTVIQWNVKAGGKLLPIHSHVNEQVTRVLVGDVEVRTGNDVYIMRAGDVMIFPSNVTHGFIALTDAVIYEQQTPIRKDFLEEGFIERLSELLKRNQ
jgi:quercetin dioxygenase-like cupin family protein